MQLVWFLAPTVALTTQQFEAIKSQITSVQGRLLCGEDCVKTWSEQRIWDAMLQNIRFVVSTYQVLSDALKHGFVSIESLALIVFDEGRFRHPPLCVISANPLRSS
jgi:ERCC4-related helicase